MKTVFSLNIVFDADIPEEKIKEAAESRNPANAFYHLIENIEPMATIAALDEDFELGIEGVYNGIVIQPDGWEWASDNFDEIIWES